MAVNSRVVLDRFRNKYEVYGDCWIWVAARTEKGYGRYFHNGRLERAHRASWMIHVGEIPDGMQVLHDCDNPACVKPEHLWLGTNRQNMDDKIAKDRQRRGSDMTTAVLNETIVREMRNNYTGRYGEQAALAKKHGVKISTIGAALSGANWRHVP